MRTISILCAGGRALVKNSTTKKIAKDFINPNSNKTTTDPKPLKSKPVIEPEVLPSQDIQDLDGDEFDQFPSSSSDLNGFSGRVHSESYSAHNLSAAFDTIISSSSPSPSSDPRNIISPPASHKIANDDLRNPSQMFLSAVKNSTLSTLEEYRHSILESLARDDPSGRIYSKNVRQMKDILSYEKWRKKVDKTLGSSELPATIKRRRSSVTKKKDSPNEANPEDNPISTPSSNTQHHPILARKELDERPTLSDPIITRKLIKEFWKLDKLVEGTVLVSYAGYPTLIDEILKLKNIKKVIAIEEKPEYCIMYTDRWKTEVENKRLFHIKNDGYWWESYSEVEEEGLLDDVQIEPWEKSHPSLFFICQLPHNKRSVQFIMQLVSFIPNRNWLFQYGRLGLGFVGSGELCQRMTREQTEKKYTRIPAAANCLTRITTPNLDGDLTQEQFFPSNLANNTPSDRKAQPVVKAIRGSKTSKLTPKKIYKSSREANPTAFASALYLNAKADLDLSPEEFECMTFLQRVMFIHSAQSWVESISHAAAGAAIMYDKLKENDHLIPKSKTPRSFSDRDWIQLAKAFNRWPFRPRSFENDLQLDSDDGPGT